MARRHWGKITEEAGLSPRGVQLRVQELVDAMVKNRVEAAQIVSDQLGANKAMVEHVAELVERNALRISGRLSDTK